MDENEIAAVRRIRHEISEECGHDVERVIAYYRSFQEELKRSGEFRFAKSTASGTLVGPAKSAQS